MTSTTTATSTGGSTTCPAGAVVVGVDGSEHSRRALDEGVLLALLQHRPLHLVHACDPAAWLALPDPSGFSVETLKDAATAVGAGLLRDARASVHGRIEASRVSAELFVIDPREALLEAAWPAAALVVGSRGRGRLRSMTLGSVGVWVSQHAPCPVVVVRPPRPGNEPHGIAVGADGTGSSATALRFAHEQAALRRVPLTVVHCVPEVFRGGFAVAGPDRIDADEVQGHRRVVAESLVGLAERYPDVEVALTIARGRADLFLSHLSPPPVLLVLGSRHRGKVGSFFGGSVSRAVVEQAPYTVAVVQAADRSSRRATVPA